MPEREVSTFAYAKVNLGLAIIGLREDGYHELQTVMQSIDLHDTVHISRQGTGIVCECGDLSGSDNLAYRVAELFMKRLGMHDGLKIKIDKNIPLQAGLAGGSSDAAATLRGLNRIYGKPLGYNDLKEIADSCGSDIAFCLKGGTQWIAGRGESLEELPEVPEMHLVIVKPSQGVNTAEAYRRFDRSGKTSSLDRSFWAKVLQEKEISKIAGLLKNDLESVSVELVPVISEIKKVLVDLGCYNSLMSGSGSAVFGIARDNNHAAEVAGILSGKGLGQVWKSVTVSGVSEDYFR